MDGWMDGWTENVTECLIIDLESSDDEGTAIRFYSVLNFIIITITVVSEET
jgi:hypothetical protein